MRFVFHCVAFAALAFGRSSLLSHRLCTLINIAGQTTLDRPPGPNTYTPSTTLPSLLNLAPSVTPNVLNPAAPNAHSLCPGYKASNFITANANIAADLTLAGPAFNVYGNDITDLVLKVQYQNATRLNIRIYPKYLVPTNKTQYILSNLLSPSRKFQLDSLGNTSDLAFQWTNTPSFQFKLTRRATGETIFDTYGRAIVFED